MTSKTIVLLLEDSGSNHGAVNEFDQPQDAERFIEGLLEAGFERQNIRALTAHDIDLLVTQKPVVSLVSDGRATAPPVEVSEEPVQVASSKNGSAEVQASGGPAEPVSVAPESEPYTLNGVRFSSAFAREQY